MAGFVSLIRFLGTPIFVNMLLITLLLNKVNLKVLNSLATQLVFLKSLVINSLAHLLGSSEYPPKGFNQNFIPLNIPFSSIKIDEMIKNKIK